MKTPSPHRRFWHQGEMRVVDGWMVVCGLLAGTGPEPFPPTAYRVKSRQLVDRNQLVEVCGRNEDILRRAIGKAVLQRHQVVERLQCLQFFFRRVELTRLAVRMISDDDVDGVFFVELDSAYVRNHDTAKTHDLNQLSC